MGAGVSAGLSACVFVWLCHCCCCQRRRNSQPADGSVAAKSTSAPAFIPSETAAITPAVTEAIAQLKDQMAGFQASAYAFQNSIVSGQQDISQAVMTVSTDFQRFVSERKAIDHEIALILSDILMWTSGAEPNSVNEEPRSLPATSANL